MLLISDASVLIDIEHGNLTKAMFSLPYRFVVPDILFEEELSKRHGHLVESGLVVRQMSGELMAQASQLREKRLRTSLNDLLALTLAMQDPENCQLLTGDKALRNFASQFKVEVHGTIWLVDQMIRSKKINHEFARNAFRQMKFSGSRLPWIEIDKMFNMYNL